MKYAKGNLALGTCDRCGMVYKLKELKWEIEDGRRNGLLVCDTCIDEDHPQNFLDEAETDDAIALKDPRPDPNLTAQRAGYGFGSWLNPAGPFNVSIQVGRVRVTTS